MLPKKIGILNFGQLKIKIRIVFCLSRQNDSDDLKKINFTYEKISYMFSDRSNGCKL